MGCNVLMQQLLQRCLQEVQTHSLPDHRYAIWMKTDQADRPYYGVGDFCGQDRRPVTMEKRPPVKRVTGLRHRSCSISGLIVGIPRLLIQRIWKTMHGWYGCNTSAQQRTNAVAFFLDKFISI